MRIRMQKPEDGGDVWMISDPWSGTLGFVKATPELKQMMPEQVGDFEASPAPHGWAIKCRVFTPILTAERPRRRLVVDGRVLTELSWQLTDRTARRT
jgi:hypothetical protein